MFLWKVVSSLWEIFMLLGQYFLPFSSKRPSEDSLLPISVEKYHQRIHFLIHAVDHQGYKTSLDHIKRWIHDYPAIETVYVFHPDSQDRSYATAAASAAPPRTTYITYNTSSQADSRLGKASKENHYTSMILEGWRYLNQLPLEADTIVLSFVYSKDLQPVLTSSFPRFLDLIQRNSSIDLILLGKNRRLASESDWHDLAIAGFRPRSSAYRHWLDSFQQVYSYYSSNRTAFVMLDPRPAILEALALSSSSQLGVHYLTNKEICSIAVIRPSFMNQLLTSISHGHGKHDHHHHHDYHRSHSSLCSHVYSPDTSPLAAIQVHCGSTSRNATDVCMSLDIPSYWMNNINRKVPNTFRREGQAKNDPIHLLWSGGLRLRNTSNYHPREFCWEKKSSTQERLSRSHIDHGPKIESYAYNHSGYEYYSRQGSNLKIVLMTGSDASASSLDTRKFLTISKMYYAKRYGYTTAYGLSDEVAEYFPRDLFSSSMGDYATSAYFRGIMTKPIMMLDVMYRHLQHEWLVWTDDDVYINPGWLYLPLDVFLADVPEHKVMVMANYRSAFTNVLFIRNNAQGRRLMMDWIAIVMSGYIQCHGYDQAALAALIAQRASYDHSFSTTKPLNYTCLYQKKGHLGCDGGADWSCDFKFEKALYLAGFKTKQSFAFFGGKMSSYSMGCANDVIRDFHVITETETRPRLQCGLCTREDEVESSGHWDGPLGGGNLLLLRGKINGYFFNHKMDILFYESYLREDGCRYLADVVDTCGDEQLHLLSLADGYAFDLEHRTYCKLRETSHQELIEQQYQVTYMKSYQRYIDLINQISDNDWLHRYKSFEGGYGRAPCKEGNKNCNEDGQRKRVKNKDMYERGDYCQQCRRISVPNPELMINDAVDCRSIEEVEREKKLRLT
jgi:hypothetical protein